MNVVGVVHNIRITIDDITLNVSPYSPVSILFGESVDVYYNGHLLDPNLSFTKQGIEDGSFLTRFINISVVRIDGNGEVFLEKHKVKTFSTIQEEFQDYSSHCADKFPHATLSELKVRSGDRIRIIHNSIFNRMISIEYDGKTRRLLSSNLVQDFYSSAFFNGKKLALDKTFYSQGVCDGSKLTSTLNSLLTQLAAIQEKLYEKALESPGLVELLIERDQQMRTYGEPPVALTDMLRHIQEKLLEKCLADPTKSHWVDRLIAIDKLIN